MLGPEFKHVKSVLCLGAHADDIEIGCGGTVLRLIEEHPGLEVRWVVFSGRGKRREEALESARAFTQGAARRRVIIEAFEDGFFPYRGEAIKRAFEGLKAKMDPDLVLTHHRDDLHQDHRLVSDLTWNTFRDHLVWEYEVPKYDGDLGMPNLYVALGEELAMRKVRDICRIFRTQAKKHWFSDDTFIGLMRLRGIECGPGTRHAEAFYARKLVV